MASSIRKTLLPLIAVIFTALAVSSSPAQAQSFDSSGTLSVAYGCDSFAAYVAASDHEIASWLNTSGGYGYLGSRFYTRYSPTILECKLDLKSKNGGPISGCQATVVVGGTDYNVTGWTITYRRCYA